MLSGSQGNVQNAREELDFYESLEMTHSILGGLTESKKMIGCGSASASSTHIPIVESVVGPNAVDQNAL